MDLTHTTRAATLDHICQPFPSLPRCLNHACQNLGEGSITANSQRTRRRHTLQHPPSSHSQSSRSRFKVSLQIRYLAYRFRLPPTSGMWLVLFKLGQHCQQGYGPQSTQAEATFHTFHIHNPISLRPVSIFLSHRFILKPLCHK